jgi:VIT1/CCC1 family predicted Fe2+/Mn2+ transporter
MIVLLPFLFSALIGNVLICYVLSLGVAMISLFGLGMFLGQISGRSLMGYGWRTVIAGVVAIVINAVLPLN